jgi:hypothetical protein
MKPRAYSRNKFSGEFYKFVREKTGDTSTLRHYFVGNVNFTAGLDTASRLTILSNEPFPIGSIIANIKDSDGNLILDDQIWQISNLQPVLNAFNTLDSYTMRAVKYQGTI